MEGTRGVAPGSPWRRRVSSGAAHRASGAIHFSAPSPAPNPPAKCARPSAKTIHKQILRVTLRDCNEGGGGSFLTYPRILQAQRAESSLGAPIARRGLFLCFQFCGFFLRGGLFSQQRIVIVYAPRCDVCCLSSSHAPAEDDDPLEIRLLLGKEGQQQCDVCETTRGNQGDLLPALTAGLFRGRIPLFRCA